MPRLVPVEDEDISKELLRVFKKKGITCHVGAKVDKVEKTKDGVSVAFTSAEGKKEKLDAEKVLIAVGRGPNTEKIGLEKAPSIKTERGFVHVNEGMETGEKGVYAIGDIVPGMPQLAHVGGLAAIVTAPPIPPNPPTPITQNTLP